MIAVYVNEQGIAALPGEKGFVRVYDKKEKEWLLIHEYPFELDQKLSIAEIRRYLLCLIQNLKGCSVFVANQVIGQLYYVLEANKFESFEAEGQPIDFLDSIHEEIKKEPRKQGNQRSSPEMYINSTEEVGVFFVNLKSALNMDCSLTSKKLLLPFLRKKEFTSLEIHCDHVPRWFHTELAPMKLHPTIIKTNENEYRIFIKPIK